MIREPNAWLTRSGRYGERDTWALEGNWTPGGFGEVTDLTACRSLGEVRDLVALAYPDKKPQAQSNIAAQLWTLVGRMSEGDLVVLPLKSSSQLAIGRVVGAYEYLAGEADNEQRHVRPVEWLRVDLPRSAVKQDLLYSLGAFSTYCGVKRNSAAQRIAALALNGTDPGSSSPFTTTSATDTPGGDDETGTDEPAVDVEQFAKDRITAVIQESFAGHRMQELVAAVLRARGFTCRISPNGTDGGVDILAGSGPLGVDAPRLVVQVKSEQSPVGDPVVSQLLGSVSKHQSAQGLLVAWGGATQPARKTLIENYFRIRMWTSEDLIAQITEHYVELPEEMRADLPLKQIWIAVEETP